MTTTSGSVYYHHDGLGNTIAITNGNAEVLERYSYDVFGQVTIVDASTGNSIPQSGHGVRHFYTGHDFQAELGLYLTHYRAYEPNLGRWLSADPIGEAGGINLYGYVGNDPINGLDPYGLYDFYEFMDDASNFSAGVGDNLSFGLTGAIRESLPGIYGDNGGVDKCSGAYGAGEWTGTGLALATGAAGGIKAAGAKAAGKEFSHWIPNRMGGPRSIWNGNYVSPARHYKHDPFRYPPGWRDLGPKWNPALQQLDRIPNAIKGGAAGAAYGGASQAANSRERP
jgi:RHS repeat-associated protein